MLIIKHRQNCSSDLSSLDTSYGAEIDIRSDGAKLYIHHDPFKEGESLSTWLSSYRHGKLILNVKEEGLESSIIALLQTYDITDYFFLDQSFPLSNGTKTIHVLYPPFGCLNTNLLLLLFFYLTTLNGFG